MTSLNGSPGLDRQQHIQEFLAATPFAGADMQPLAGDASFRRYLRIRKKDQTAMLMDAPPEKEDIRPYLNIAGHLCRHGYSAPEVYASDAAHGLMLLEDFGDDSFTAVLKQENTAGPEQELYAVAVDLLADWHGRKSVVADAAQLPLPAYDHSLLMREALLFSSWYLPQVAGKEKAVALAAEYTALWENILRSVPLATDCWVHRDYHADNLMWLPARQHIQRVGLLDFQDGVYGDAAYDMVSLLEDARRDVPDALSKQMIARYVAATGCDREQFTAAYAVLGAQRNSKIVGIFVRLAARDGKYGYLRYLPRVWRHLERDLAHPALSPLRAWLDTHVPADHRGEIKVRHTSHDLALSA